MHKGLIIFDSPAQMNKNLSGLLPIILTGTPTWAKSLVNCLCRAWTNENEPFRGDSHAEEQETAVSSVRSSYTVTCCLYLHGWECLKRERDDELGRSSDVLETSIVDPILPVSTNRHHPHWIPDLPERKHDAEGDEQLVES